MTPEEFKVCLTAPEGANYEFKEAKRNFHFEELVKYCVAIANEGGGLVVLGVTDRRPRNIVGTKAFSEPGRTEAGLFARLGRRIRVEEYFEEGRRVLIFHVPPRPPGAAWNDRGVFWMRSGDALVPMSSDQLRVIHAETGPDFSAEICAGASLSALDSSSVDAFRVLWAKKTNNPRITEWSDEKTLADAELITEDGITYAALILLGGHKALGRYLGQAEVVFEYRSSEASGPSQERIDYRKGFISFQDAIWKGINGRNDLQSYQEGLFRFDIPTFDEVIVREGILNAVCHRDYRLGGSIFIRQYPKRLEITSPGGFPPGISTDNILDRQNPRNRRLAEAFAKCGMVERSGQGMNLMFERSILQSKSLPDFQGTSEYEVRLVLNGAVQNPEFIRFLERIGQERLESFSTHDFLVLDYLQNERRVPEKLKPRLRRLISLGIVESIGRGRGTRYMLSRSLYAQIGKKGVYTRRKGLDRNTNKALLLEHIRDNAETGARFEEMHQVLPSLSRHQIQALLKDLKKDGRVYNEGRTRAARWFPASKDI